MAITKHTVELETTDTMPAAETVEEPTDEQKQAWEDDRKREHDADMEPYRAFAQANADRDELLAELLFEITLMELEG